MTWFKVDDSFYDHPKVFDAPDAAVALWVRAGCWAARNLTDGKVPSKLPARLCDDPETAVSELLSRGLWEVFEDGYRFRDWTDYQPSAERVKKTRAARAEAGSRGGRAKAAKQSSSKLPGGGQGSASDARKQKSAPTRPDPTHTSPNGEGEDKPPSTRKRATRLPEPFDVTEDMREWARRETPDIGQSEHEKFCDYFRAAPGQKGVKRDWVATWRNWMRRAQESAPARPGNVVALRGGNPLDEKHAILARERQRAIEMDALEGRA
ncbi:hypothetical protein GCM10027447_12680 [Glycomyces halotolerans]